MSSASGCAPDDANFLTSRGGASRAFGRRSGDGSSQRPVASIGVDRAAAGGDYHDGIVARRQLDVWPGQHVFIVALDRALSDAVHVERRGAEVRADLHLRERVGARGEAAVGDVEGGGARPVGLVKVEGVLLRLAAVGDQSFVVAAGRVAVVAEVGGVIVQVPDELRP